MKNLKSLLTAILCTVLLVGCATPNERLSVYNYSLYYSMGTMDRVGRLELLETPKGASVRIISGSNSSQCVASRLSATVTRDDSFTTIVTDPAFGNCDSVKYQIRNDGKGGARYTLVGGEWIKDQYDRVLTPRD